ncbi:hypothetical protein [Plantactinospora sonchi]|uniref:Zinc-finger domain-containing protein n=1 Tax=Plantactinospora sonchi TaxID=1544735 RepID=A0ABU7RPP0_9ACTN
MTGGQFREVDLDLLADYVGGALDGTPDEAEVSRLVTQSPDWAAAYAALTGGLDGVRHDLAALATAAEPMPAAVVDRLDLVLGRAALAGPAAQVSRAEPAADAGPADRTGTDDRTVSAAGATSTDNTTEDPEPDGGRVPRRTGRQLPAVPVQARTAPSSATRGPGRRRRWVRRAAGPVVLAVVVVGFAGFAISRLGVTSGSSDQAAGTAYTATGDVAENAPMLGSGPPRTVPEPSTERVLSSGSNYTSSTLAGTADGLAREPLTRDPVTSESSAAVGEQDSPAGSPDDAATGVPDSRTSGTPKRVPGLERLADPAVLARCLDAVAAAHARGPVTVELVDYARFEGSAALVVVFTDRSGVRWAWATGPECGTSPTEADVTYQTRVG